MLVELGKIAIFVALAIIAMRAFLLFREWRERRATLARMDAMIASARHGTEFLAEIPDGASVKFLGNGNIIIAHPDYEPRIIYPDGKVEDVRPNG